MTREENEAKFFTKSSKSEGKPTRQRRRQRQRPRTITGKLAVKFRTDKSTVRKSLFTVTAAFLIMAGTWYSKVYGDVDNVDYFHEENSTLIDLVGSVARGSRTLGYDSRDVEREINQLNTGANMSKYRKVYTSLSDNQKNTIKKILLH